MVYNIERANRLKESTSIYKDLLQESMKVLSAILDYGIHSSQSIEILSKIITDDFIQMNGDTTNSSSQESQKNIDNDTRISFRSKRKYINELSHDDEMELIRFSNTSPVFRLSKRVIESLRGSYIYEQYIDDIRTTDGSIYLDYEGSDVCIYYFLDYLNGKKLNIDEFEYNDQLELLELIEFCNLPLPAEWISIREQRAKKKKYEEGYPVVLLINSYEDSILSDYLKMNYIWDIFINKYDSGFVDYDRNKNIYFMDMKYDYIQYIYEYIQTRSISCNERDLNAMNKNLFKNELKSVFGSYGENIYNSVFMGKPSVFKNSRIVTIQKYSLPLMNWLGKDKTWKLLYRASEQHYSALQFHKYCDNKGETVTIIKHLGHNNHINIFGGYTDQSWNCTNSWKPYSKEFLFTLTNEHNIPPTKYDFISTFKKRSIYCDAHNGPTFGCGADIAISDQCQSNKNSYCNAISFGEYNTIQKKALFVNTNDESSKNNFRVVDYEVWGRE
ncbi:hypothetical protein WA158_002096 [Blastocystis sp. Blastoise]